MGGRRECIRRNCESRYLRYRSLVGLDPFSFFNFKGSESSEDRQAGESYIPILSSSTISSEMAQEETREISMIIYCKGQTWKAKAIVPVEDEGTREWLALAIAALDISVDMAVSDDHYEGFAD